MRALKEFVLDNLCLQPKDGTRMASKGFAALLSDGVTAASGREADGTLLYRCAAAFNGASFNVLNYYKCSRGKNNCKQAIDRIQFKDTIPNSEE